MVMRGKRTCNVPEKYFSHLIAICLDDLGLQLSAEINNPTGSSIICDKSIVLELDPFTSRS